MLVNVKILRGLADLASARDSFRSVKLGSVRVQDVYIRMGVFRHSHITMGVCEKSFEWLCEVGNS